MKIFAKLKQFFYLNEDFFVRAQKYSPEAAHGAADSARPKRIWLYAESLGEFRLAARITDIIKSLLSVKNAPRPLFFISFKTYSALSLAQNNKDGGILFFFHPFPGLRTIFKKYVSAVKPDYFISVQHPISKKLVKELLNPVFGAKLIFMGISPSGLKKMDIKYGEREIPSGFSLSAAVSGVSGAETVELNILPLSLKYASCFEIGEDSNDYGQPLPAQRSNPVIVISFVSVHKKESGFILKLLREIISDESLRQEFSLKFIFVPRNIKNSRRLFKEASKIGLNPLYYRGKDENTNGENKEKKENKGGFEDFFKSGGNGSGGGVKSLIVDKYGVLDEIYPVSDIVYVGKSLFKSEQGGHNVLEPASYGKTVVTGSYAVNFKDIISEMVRFDAITETDEKNFKDILIKLIKDEKLRGETGKNGLKFCLQKKEEFETYFKNYLTEIVVL